MRRAGDGAGHRLGELGEHDALVLGRLDDLGGLEDLFVAPFRVQRLDPLGLEIVLAVPDRVHGGQRDILVGTVVAGDMVGEQFSRLKLGLGVPSRPTGAAIASFLSPSTIRCCGPRSAKSTKPASDLSSVQAAKLRHRAVRHVGEQLIDRGSRETPLLTRMSA